MYLEQLILLRELIYCKLIVLLGMVANLGSLEQLKLMHLTWSGEKPLGGPCGFLQEHAAFCCPDLQEIDLSMSSIALV